MEKKKSGNTEYSLILWSAIINIPCLAFIGFAWWKFRWIQDIVALDALYISRAIMVFTAYAICAAAMHIWKASRELNLAQRYVHHLQDGNADEQAKIESGTSMVAGFIGDIKGLNADGRREIGEIFADNVGLWVSSVAYNLGRITAAGFLGTLIGIGITLKVFDIPLTDSSQVLGLFSQLPIGLRIAVYPAILAAIGALWLDLQFQVLDTGSQKLISWVRKAGVQYAQQQGT